MKTHVLVVSTHVLVVSTDRGSNLIVALKDTGRIHCNAYITVQQNSFDKKKKNCPANIKKNPKKQLLTHSLKQSCDTRCNSNYFPTMLKTNLKYSSNDLATIDLSLPSH